MHEGLELGPLLNRNYDDPFGENDLRGLQRLAATESGNPSPQLPDAL